MSCLIYIGIAFYSFINSISTTKAGLFKQIKFHFIAFLYLTISISGLTIHPLFLNLDNVYVLHTNVDII
jgi:hypothetical protein